MRLLRGNGESKPRSFTPQPSVMALYSVHTEGSMMKQTLKTLIWPALASAAVASGAMASPPPHFRGAELLKVAKVNLTRATAIALKARPGKITDQELEREKGGSGLRYSFDIRSGGKPYEVGIDAATGVVLENKAEGAHPD